MFRVMRAILAAASLAALVATPALGEPPRAGSAISEASRFVDLPKGRLHVVTLTPRRPLPGPPLLLLHGAGSNLKDLQESIGRRLAARRRVILIDRPGHGLSDRLGGREMASPAAQAEAIVAALDRLGVRRAFVVGLSWSGAVTANLALDHRNRVAGLVILSGATNPWSRPVPWYYEAAATPAIGPVFAATIVPIAGDEQVNETLAEVFSPRPPPPGYLDRVDGRQELSPGRFVATSEDLVDLRPFLARQSRRHREIRLPTTIIASADDRIVDPDEHARRFHAEVRGSRLVMLPGAGHMAHWTATARVTAEIEAAAASASAAPRRWTSAARGPVAPGRASR